MSVEDFDLSVIYTREDGSFVINKGMYHVPNEGEWADLWAQVDAYAKEHPEVVTPEPVPVRPEPTPEEIQKRLTDAVQRALDAFASTRGYDGIMSACSYASSTDAQFKLEADYCVALRDTTWRMGYAIVADVKAGLRPIPTAEELIAELPIGSAKWPDEVAA